MAPYMGTVIHNIAYELGLMEVHDKPGFKGMCTKNISMRVEPVMENPCMSKERIMELFYDFADYVHGRKEIPEKFLKKDSSRKYADDAISKAIYEAYERYKKGPVDPAKINRKNLSDFHHSITAQI